LCFKYDAEFDVKIDHPAEVSRPLAFWKVGLKQVGPAEAAVLMQGWGNPSEADFKKKWDRTFFDCMIIWGAKSYFHAALLQLKIQSCFPKALGKITLFCEEFESEIFSTLKLTPTRKRKLFWQKGYSWIFTIFLITKN